MTSSRLRIRKKLPENLDEAKRRIKVCVLRKQRVLRLNGLGLHQIPEEVASLTWLTAISLKDNLISEVPDFIGELENLQALVLADNPIRSLPASLSRLTNLTSLLITGGSPSAANPIIGELENLASLTLGGLGLNEFPEWIATLNKLELLSLPDNHLNHLPNSLSKMRSWTRATTLFGVDSSICFNSNPTVNSRKPMSRSAFSSRAG